MATTVNTRSPSSAMSLPHSKPSAVLLTLKIEQELPIGVSIEPCGTEGLSFARQGKKIPEWRRNQGRPEAEGTAVP